MSFNDAFMNIKEIFTQVGITIYEMITWPMKAFISLPWWVKLILIIVLFIIALLILIYLLKNKDEYKTVIPL